MNHPAAREITLLLDQVNEGDERARSRLVELLYEQLRELASRQLQAWPPGHTLQPTDLLHDVCVQLFDGKPTKEWRNRQHFLGTAASAMRCLLVDHARRKKASKRGGDRQRIALEQVTSDLIALDSEGLLLLHDALERLTEVDQELGRIAELHLFGGFCAEEVADILSIPLRTVERRWRAGRIWLQDQLDE